MGKLKMKDGNCMERDLSNNLAIKERVKGKENQNIYYKADEFENVKDIIVDCCNKYSKNIAYTIKEKEGVYTDKTYAQLLEDIYSLGNVFYDKKLKGKRIGIFGKNQYNWVVSHLTCLFGSCVSVPLDKDLENEELLNSVNRAELDVVIFDPAKKDKIEFLKENVKEKEIQYIAMRELEGYENVTNLIEQGKKITSDEFKDNEIDNKELAILLFTSGTTSAPKAIMLNQKNVASNVYALNCCEDIRSNDVNIAFLPFHHIFGSTNLVMMLSCGVKTVFPDGLKYIQKNLNEYKVSVFVGVPLLVESIYKAIQKEIKRQNKEKLVAFGIKLNNVTKKVGLDLSKVIFKQIIDKLGGKLRLMVIGGAPIREEVLKGFNDLGIQTANGYGLSETAPVICSENMFVKGGAGKAMCNVEMAIDNPDENGIGEVKAKGPNIFMGYYNDEEKTKEVMKDGWFLTGDIGYIQDGKLYITGREKSMIVLHNGKKIFPEEIEQILDDMDLVSESIVFGYENNNKILTIAKVVLDKETVKEKYPNKTKEELYDILWNEIKELNTKFPRYKHIQKLIISDDELVKTTTKKIKRHVEIEKTVKEME